MIDHLFRCVVIEVIAAPAMAALDDRHFRFAMLCLMRSNERWQLPCSPRGLQSVVDPEGLLGWRTGQIADMRDRLSGLGFLRQVTARGADGLEIAPEFRRETSAGRLHGDPQLALALPGELSVVPKKPPVSAKKQTTEIRTDQRIEPIPPVCEQLRSQSANHWKEGNRAGRETGESGKTTRFSRTVAQLMACALGKRLGEWLGAEQMAAEARRSGEFWLLMFSTHAEMLGDLLEQGARDHTLSSPRTRVRFLMRRLMQRVA